MSAHPKFIPASSQTVGPFFSIGLDYLAERSPAMDAGAAGNLTIRGRVLDRDGAPVPDAILEFWNGAATRDASASEDGFPEGFRRTATDEEGIFSVVMRRPPEVELEDGRVQAPHMLVLVFMRGLLRHLISRVYFESDAGIGTDPVLLAIPPERRRTLIAQRHGENSYRWDVILQGTDETVFFAW
jgi:protocatechuate 3,4-dioxygenase alpha subunit